MHAPAHLLDHRSPFAEMLGIELVSAGGGEAHYHLPFSDRITTVGDVVHGGAILTLADCAATGAAWSEVDMPERYRGLTADLSHAFLSAARGVDLDAHARVVRRGRSLVFCRVDISDTHAEIVATAQVTYKLSYMATPSEVLMELFDNRPLDEQMGLLAELEDSGARIYRAWAEDARAVDRRRVFLAAAEREEVNARVLREALERLAT